MTIMRSVHFSFTVVNHASDDNFVCVCRVMFYQLLSELLLVTRAPPNHLKTARMKSDFSWVGGRTFCLGRSSWLHLLLREVLAPGVFFLPHTREHSSRSEQALASGTMAWQLRVGTGSMLSSPSARQDLEEGFTELDIEGSIDHGVEGAVHVAQPRGGAVKLWGHVAGSAVGIENVGQKEGQPADNECPWVAKEERNWIRGLLTPFVVT